MTTNDRLTLSTVLKIFNDIPGAKLGIGPHHPACLKTEELDREIERQFRHFPALKKSKMYVEFCYMHAGAMIRSPDSNLVFHLDGESVYDDWHWPDSSVQLMRDPFVPIAHVRLPAGERMDFSFSTTDAMGEAVFCSTPGGRKNNVLIAIPYAPTFLGFLKQVVETQGVLPIPDALAPFIRRRNYTRRKLTSPVTGESTERIRSLIEKLHRVSGVIVGTGVSDQKIAREIDRFVEDSCLDAKVPDFATFQRLCGGAEIVRSDDEVFVELVGPAVEEGGGWADAAIALDDGNAIPICFVKLPGANPGETDRYDYFFRARGFCVTSERVYWASSTVPQKRPKLFAQSFIEFFERLVAANGILRPE